jgi:hypothetical protein
MSAEPILNALDTIRPNEVVTMKRLWSMLFKHAGCNPTCHGCGKILGVGVRFKLSTMPKHGDEQREVMLCEKCTPASIKEKDRKAEKEWAARVKAGTAGCYRINGKIVP